MALEINTEGIYMKYNNYTYIQTLHTAQSPVLNVHWCPTGHEKNTVGVNSTL